MPERKAKMSVALKIDHREGKLKELFGSAEHISYENLAHGDVQILVDGKVLCCFERKTTEDLMASIKDGRYKNQKKVLFDSGFQPSQIYYIIEGNIRLTTKSAAQKSLIGAMINTMVRDKICTMITRNLEETHELIGDIFSRVKKEPTKYTSPESAGQIITMTQAEKVTPEICYRNQLCQIPDVSEKTAAAVMQIFPTMRSLILELNAKDAEERLDILKGLKGAGGRKISGKAAANVAAYLF
jgi:ERCC4-type nuclease